MSRRREGADTLWPAASAAAALMVASGPALAEEAGIAAFLGDVIGNATYESETVLTAYPRNADQAESEGIEDEGVEGWTHLGIDSTTFLGDYWSFGLGLDAVASTYEGAEQGVFTLPSSRSGQGRYVDLSRLTLTYLGDTVEVMAGKDQIPFGVAELYAPTDLYGATNTAFPQQGVDFGVWQLRSDVYLGSDRLTAIILPVEESVPGPADASRWAGGDSGLSEFSSVDIPGLPPNVTADIQDDLRGAAPEEWGYLAQYKGTATGVDYFFSGYYGPGPYPVLRRPPSGQVNPYAKLFPTVTIASAGAAVTEGAWKLYAEGLGYRAVDDQDEDVSRVVVGAKYRETRLANSWGLDEITPVIEYAKEWRHDEQGNPDYAVSSAEARPNRNNILMSLTVKVDAEWRVGAFYNRSLENRDAVMSAYIRYQPNDNLWLALSGVEYHGRDDTQFGRFSRHDNVSLAVNYKF